MTTNTTSAQEALTPSATTPVSGLPTHAPAANDTTAIAQTGASYVQRVTIDIPAELLVAYLVIKGLLDGMPTQHYWAYYTAIGFIALLVFPYMGTFKRITSVRRKVCAIISFVVWTICLGGQHVGRFEEYIPAFASIFLILWSLFLAWFLYDTARSDPS